MTSWTKLVKEARDSAHRLSIHVHYMACGVAQSSEQKMMKRQGYARDTSGKASVASELSSA